MLKLSRPSGRTKLKALLITLTLVVLVASLSVAFRKALSFRDANTISFQFPLVLTTRDIIVIRERQKPKPIVITVYVKEPICTWDKACVESYIDFVAKGDTRFSQWAKFAANYEGGYQSQLAQQNWADSHSNGDKGSFGQFQFGKGTYEDHCEPNKNWQMDWKAQTRCAKTIWDKGIAHSTWFNTTNKYLTERGLNRLSFK